MEGTKNEQGYALVTVLLIIVIFMILFLSFSAQSFSSMKQNQVVEKSSKSTALAEMGVNYYKSLIQQMYVSNQLDFSNNGSTDNQKLRNIIQQNIQDKTVSAAITDSNIKTQIANLMAGDIAAEAINKCVSQTCYPLTDNNQNPIKSEYFKLNQISFSVDSGPKITFTYEVEGNDNGKATTLDANITLDMSIIKVNYALPSFTTFNSSINLSSLSPLTGNGDFGNYNNVSNVTLFTNNTLAFDDINSPDTVNLLAYGDISIRKNLNKGSNLTVETNGNINYTQQFEVASSQIFVKQNFLISPKDNGSHLIFTGNSLAFIGGDVSAERLDIDSSSKMCVQGNVSAPTLNTGNLYVLGKVNNLTTYTVDQQTFNMNCGFPDFSNPVDWGSGTKAIITNVTYK